MSSLNLLFKPREVQKKFKNIVSLKFLRLENAPP